MVHAFPIVKAQCDFLARLKTSSSPSRQFNIDSREVISFFGVMQPVALNAIAYLRSCTRLVQPRASLRSHTSQFGRGALHLSSIVSSVRLLRHRLPQCSTGEWGPFTLELARNSLMDFKRVCSSVFTMVLFSMFTLLPHPYFFQWCRLPLSRNFSRVDRGTGPGVRCTCFRC